MFHSLRLKLKDLALLTKFRVDVVVAMTGVFGYLFGKEGQPDWYRMTLLFFGGLLVTASAHVINQIIERHRDRKMSRTASRPLASGKMTVAEAAVYALVFSLPGLLMLYAVHPLSAFVSAVSLIIYGFLYTPMKILTRLSIYMGAVPGALPIIIGYIAATGGVDLFAVLLFVLQVVWQLPHSWSITWLWYDDYSRGGYDLMPLPGGKTRANALLTFLSVWLMFPVIYALYHFQYIGHWTMMFLFLLTFVFVYTARVFSKEQTRTSARRLLLYSVFYLPVIQILIIVFKR